MWVVTNARRQREINRVSKCKWPRDDRECAFKVLDLQATSQRRQPPHLIGAALMNHANNILDMVAQIHWWPPTDENNRRYRAMAYAATEKVLHAVETLGPYRNFTWCRDNVLQVGEGPWAPPIVITALDQPLRLHPTMNPPEECLEYGGHRQHYMFLPKEPKRPPGVFPARPRETIMWSPTPNEVQEHSRIRWRDWWDGHGDGDGPEEGFPRTEVFAIGLNRTPVTVHSTPMDGNCYWYAIAIALYGIDQVDRFAEIKANVRNYFMQVLEDPAHPRYCTYVHLQVNSRVRDSRQPYNHQRQDYVGETSIARCLHRNKAPGYISRWRPRPFNSFPNQPNPGFGLNQIVADCYNVCVVELEESTPWDPNTEDYPDDPVDALARWWDIYTFRGDLNNRWIYIFNDSREHFWGLFRQGHFNDPANFIPPTIPERLDPMPWHYGGPRPADRLRPLPPNMRLPAYGLAPQVEVDHVAGNGDIWWVNMPAIPQPWVRNGWVSQYLPNPAAIDTEQEAWIPRTVARLGRPPFGRRELP